jgi:hypothetical protein
MRVDGGRHSSYMPRHSWESLIKASSNALQLLKIWSLTAAATVEFGSNS